MRPTVAPSAPTPAPSAEPDTALPLRLLLRFTDAAFERRFVARHVAFYFRYAQVSLLLGMLLVLGDYLVDRIAHGGGPANQLRLTLAVPVLAGGLVYSLLPQARRLWQPVMAGFIATVALCLFEILVRIDAEGGAGLNSWVGVLNFIFLQFYCFVILGVQFRHALVAGLVILAAFELALWQHAGLTAREAAYGTYHVVTSFLLAAGIGWWREFVLRKEFAARSALDDSRRAAEERALRLAHYDEVTGLPNQRLFSDLATPILARTARDGTRCAVLHVQIDRLGSVHDVYGRALGDVLLAGIAARLRTSIRGSDVAVVRPAGDASGVLARHGDSAFSILVADLDSQERASLVAQRLLAAVAQPVAVDGRPLVLSASIGVAVCPGDGTDLAGLAHCAEQAAHAALRSGGAQHRFFDEALNTRARERVQLESELRHAIAAGQLRLHFQPKVDTGAPGAPVVGAEALVRWQHPRRGLLAPGQFIALAEECGLIVPLTDWVLQTACQSLRRWADAGLAALPLSVNLAAPSLADPGLVDQLGTLMQQHRLQPSSLVLELTESMLIHDAAATIGVLQRLRTHGFALSLDDFGTGYSSMAYLRRMPIDELKIDRAFITDAAQGGRDGALAATIITLGRELGLRVVAEGVETPAQSAFLLARGCTLQQGYLFSRPVPEERYLQLLRAGTTGRTSEAPAAADAHHATAAAAAAA